MFRLRPFTNTDHSEIVIKNMINMSDTSSLGGWSGGAMVLSKHPVTGRPTIWMTVGQGPIALAEGAGGDCLDIFTFLYLFSPLFPSLGDDPI